MILGKALAHQLACTGRMVLFTLKVRGNLVDQDSAKLRPHNMIAKPSMSAVSSTDNHAKQSHVCEMAAYPSHTPTYPSLQAISHPSELQTS